MQETKFFRQTPPPLSVIFYQEIIVYYSRKFFTYIENFLLESGTHLKGFEFTTY